MLEHLKRLKKEIIVLIPKIEITLESPPSDNHCSLSGSRWPSPARWTSNSTRLTDKPASSGLQAVNIKISNTNIQYQNIIYEYQNIRYQFKCKCKYTLDRQAYWTNGISWSYNNNHIDGWTTDDLIYHWKKDDPVQITDDLNLPRWKQQGEQVENISVKTTGKKI